MQACAVRCRATLDPEPHGTLHAVQQYQSESPPLYFHKDQQSVTVGKRSALVPLNRRPRHFTYFVGCHRAIAVHKKVREHAPGNGRTSYKDLKNKTMSDMQSAMKKTNRIGSKSSS
jgi:hypothetical protein